MNITFTDDNGAQTPIEAKPASVHAETNSDGQVCVTIGFDRDDLAVNDPDAYKALMAAFPGHGALTLDADSDQQPPQDPGTPGTPGQPQPLPTEDAEDPLFQGSVTGVSQSMEHLRIMAVADNGDGGGEPGGDQPTVTVVPNATDTSGLTVDITVDNKGQGAGKLDLGDGSPAQDNPGDGTTATSYAYPAAGSYTVTFTDADDATRTASAAVTVPATA